MFCPQCGKDVGEKSFCPQCGAAVSAEAIEKVGNEAPAMPMKWFKFLIWFTLFVAALSNLVTGLNMLTGNQYEGLANRVYALFKDLKTVDMLFGLLMIGLAAFAIYTRFRLSGFYKNGPLLLNIVYGANAGIGLIYLIAADAATKGVLNLDYSSAIISLVTSIAMIIINAVYFKKRAHLFVK